MRMRGYTYKEIKTSLEKRGWEVSHRRSNHITFKKENCPIVLTVPAKCGELSRPLCKRLLKSANIY